MIQRSLYSLIFFLSALALMAQENCSYSLKGKVKAAITDETIPFATVILKGNTELSQVSTSNGSFNFSGLCSSEVILTVRFVGFQTYSDTLTLSSGGNTIEVLLQENVHELEEVLVIEEGVEEVATIARAEVNAKALEKLGGESLGKSLSGLSGVNMLQSGPTIAKPVIHGLHSNRILILNNGIRQEGQQWGQEHAPEIDPFVANNLRLIKGAAAVKYGSDAIGGVILVNPAELPRSEGLSGKASMVGASNNGMYAGSMLVEGGLKGLRGFGWRFQGTYKRAGDASAPQYRLTNTGTLERNFSLGAGYHTDALGAELFYSSFDAEIGILRSAHIGNLTDLERAIGRDRPLFVEDFSYTINNPYQAVNHQLLKANGHMTLENIGELSAQYGLQINRREEFDIRRAGRSTIPALALDLYTHTIDLDFDMLPQGSWKWDVGASFMYQNNENDPETGIRPLIPDFENWTAGAHVISRFIQTNYELEAGARYDFRHYLIKRFDRNNNLLKPEFDFSNLTGSVGALFFLSNNLQLRTNIGTAWRAPHVNELYSEGLHHGAAAVEEGNPELESEKSVKWITSLEKNTEKLAFNFSGYINLITDYIYLRPEDVALTIRGAFPVFRYRQTDALLTGIDADVSYKISDRLENKSKLSVIYAQDQRLRSPLINIPANSVSTALEYALNLKGFESSHIGFELAFTDRQRNAPRVVSIAEILEANESDSDLFASDQSVFDILDVPGAYTLVNLEAGLEKRLRNSALRVNLAVTNLFNVEYRDYLNRFRYYSAEMGRNITLRLNYEF
ncbi:TonB-dependent receptor [uncultured Roseivirga sp.]|uniref:TonB-dependent receptor n=1 Tax=uncultured Roseivirga sp. TaxID=543088 RepID=UPI0025828686|nr:TonB-dependent receptor [uncultured Roseivirga sp.]|tara:strand:+ start:4361 stop:6739 length:2379 start_codon:yes stop_codon:yes gene_type:complete